MRTLEWRKYILAFLITAAVFATAFYVSDSLGKRRLAEVETIQERIATDILSLETQFDLLEELSCKEISESSVLSTELNSLEGRLAFTEGQLGADNLEVVRLKKQYSLLQIKDYLLMKRVAQKCNLSPVFVLYFYSNAGDCADCERTGYVLTYLRETYPTLRVYSFDYNLDLGALKTLVTVTGITPTLPAIVIDEQVLYGFHELEEIEKILPLEKLEKATSTEFL